MDSRPIRFPITTYGEAPARLRTHRETFDGANLNPLERCVTTIGCRIVISRRKLAPQRPGFSLSPSAMSWVSSEWKFPLVSGDSCPL